MKTTIDISDNLMQRSKALARRENSTLKALVEEGLGLVLHRRAARKKETVRPVTFGGKGLSGEFRNASWEKIREAAYRRDRE